MLNTLIKSLQNPKYFDHSVSEFHVYETHSSMILTTGEYVYKFKKPVNFGFLDYSTLEKRQYYCQQESILNCQLAKNLYLGIVPLYGNAEHPSFKQMGEPFEYAVKMRQFPQENMLPALLANREITIKMIEKLAEVIAAFHQQAPEVEANAYYGEAEHIHQFAIDNFTMIASLLTEAKELTKLKNIEAKTQSCFEKIKSILQKRKKNGKVRRCHGDMHLNNMVIIDDQPVIFDCIDFNEDFVWTDTMGDLGFLLMDIAEHNEPAFENLLLNRYLELTGDYSALDVLPYFCAYRAMVRAKIDQIRLSQPGLTKQETEVIQKHYDTCLKLAENYLTPHTVSLTIMNGFCGSGKSRESRNIVAKTGAIRLRSDVERKRLANLSLTTKTQSGLYQGLYDPKNTNVVYEHLMILAEQIIAAGYSVIIDAAFIRYNLREQFKNFAFKLNVPFKIISCQAPDNILRERVVKRESSNKISEGRLDVLDEQLKNHDPFTKDELIYTTIINTDREKTGFYHD